MKQYERSTDENVEGLIGKKILHDHETVILKKKLEQKNLEAIVLKEKIFIKERANILVIIIKKLRSYGFSEEYSIQKIIDSEKTYKVLRIDYLACKPFNFSYSDVINIPVDEHLQNLLMLNPKYRKRINMVVVGIIDKRLYLRQHVIDVRNLVVGFNGDIKDYRFVKSGTNEFLTHGKFLL